MKRQTFSRTSYRLERRTQILRSIPNYLAELRKVRGLTELYAFLQFKLPYFAPISTFPPRINFELTNLCNFSCQYCPRTVVDLNREIDTMDYGLAQKLVTEISRYRNCLIKIVGMGEPSLYPHCDEFMRSLRDRGVKSYFYTNGSLFQRFEHDQILEWQVPHFVVSIDGIDRQSYNHQRVGGNYDDLRNTLKAFQRRRTHLVHTKPIIEVRHVILPQETKAELAEFRRIWMEVADRVMFNHMIPNGPINSGTQPPSRRCRDIRREMYVRCNGRVPLCGYQYLVNKQEWIADLGDSTIQDAWHHTKLNELRSLHLQKVAPIPDFCAVCSQTT